jgi:hypothetical protein
MAAIPRENCRHMHGVADLAVSCSMIVHALGGIVKPPFNPPSSTPLP